MQWWCSAQGVPWDWSWQAYPGVWLFIALVAVAYAALLRRAARAGGDHGRTWAFWAGLAFLWIALDWPVGALGAGYLASVHMVQFLLIALLAPPLILLGVPAIAFRAIEARPHVRRALGVATHPGVTLVAFNLVVIATHWPGLVDALMVSQAGSFALDLAWLAGGLLFWWPVVAPVPERPGLGELVKIGYLIAATILGTVPFLFLTFSDYPLYRVFELAPRVNGITARGDQQVAGLLMKMGGGLILWTAITVLFFRLAHRADAGALERIGAAR